MLVPLDFYKAHLLQGCRPEDDFIVLSSVARKRLDAVGVGNHTYLVLNHGSFTELVRYDHIDNFKDAPNKQLIYVMRDVNHGGRKTFPIGSCTFFKWTEESLAEFNRQVVTE